MNLAFQWFDFQKMYLIILSFEQNQKQLRNKTSITDKSNATQKNPHSTNSLIT